MMQTASHSSALGGGAGAGAGRVGPPSSTWACARYMARHDGWRGFYQGIGPPLVSLTFLNTISFALFGRYKRLLVEQGLDRRLSDAQPPAWLPPAVVRRLSWWPAMEHSSALYFLAGSLTGASIGVFSTPFDLVKVQAQLASAHARSSTTAAAAHGTSSASATAAASAAGNGRGSSWQTCKRLVSDHGIGVLYRGYAVNTLREILFATTYFGLYEHLKAGLTSALQATAPAIPAPVAVVAAGSLSGMSGWAVSFPLDVLKANIQGARSLAGPPVGLWTAARAQWSAAGLSGFYRGIVPTMMRSMLVSGVRFSAYEATMRALSNRTDL
jgi:hypothetical protein